MSVRASGLEDIRQSIGRRGILAMVRESAPLQAILLSLSVLVVYLCTLAPTISPGDSPELVTAAYQLGVPHPTGYPLYMLLGHAMIRLVPGGDPAFRMNLLSAVCGAATVGLLYLLGVRIVRHRAASALGALLYGFSLTFWSQAVITEVYTLNTMLVSGALLCWLSWDRTGRRAWLIGGSFLAGLCLTHQLSSVLIAPALIYSVATSVNRPSLLRDLKYVVPAFTAPLALYLYLPWAAYRDPIMNWGDVRSLAAFVEHVTGAQYRDYMGASNLGQFWNNLVQYAGIPLHAHAGGVQGFLFSDFSYSVIWLAPLGMLHLARRQKRLFITTLLLFGASLLWALNYRIPDVEVYYLTPHLIVALWIAAGLRVVISTGRRIWRGCAPSFHSRRIGTSFVCTGLLLLPLSTVAANYRANDKSRDHLCLAVAEMVLGSLKPGAVILATGDDHLLPLFYPRYVRNLRTDVELISILDASLPRRVRLIERRRSQRLRVTVPPHYLEISEKPGLHGELIQSLVKENVAFRPIYFLGLPKESLEIMLNEGIIPGYRSAGLGLEPLFEIVTRPNSRARPALAGVGASAPSASAALRDESRGN